MDIDTNVKNFWENKHKIEDVAALSGCLYKETLDFMLVSDHITSGANVLEVGVGLGYVTKGLFEAGVEVSALDISDLSLQKVKNYCKHIYNVKEIHKLPSNYFDVIICNNVVQHVPTDLLIKELKELVRSLKVGGVFTVEFVSTIGSEDTGINPHIAAIQNGGLCRTPAYLEKLIGEAGAECKPVFDKKVDIGIVQGHHVFHVTRV